ncbi:MAG: ribosomal RNA small subunit methyltransferase A [Candidatus Omnitrophota bacterium]|nr:MAG: ribosomal RNA small subunit methyltransferase A [Candidatus Omnitrophota bacterium]
MLSSREIKTILKEEGLVISKRRGQNFLVDKHIQEKIINAISIKSGDEILEIGPGLGALTEELSKSGAGLKAIEKDRGLVKILRKRLSGYKNVEIISGDILEIDMEKFTRNKLKVVGNLPYYITTPIITYLLEKQRENINDIFITVQREVGERLRAEKNSKDYSAITILIKYFTDCRVLFPIPKRAFYPQPKVDSVFVHLHILKKPSVKVNNQEQFFKIVHSCFNQRRKTIPNSLSHKLPGIEKESIQKMLKDKDIDIKVRPENLSLEEFARIEDAFYKRGHKL